MPLQPSRLLSTSMTLHMPAWRIVRALCSWHPWQECAGRDVQGPWWITSSRNFTEKIIRLRWIDMWWDQERRIPVRENSIYQGPEVWEILRCFRNSGDSGMIGMVVIKLNKEAGIQSSRALHAIGVMVQGFLFYFYLTKLRAFSVEIWHDWILFSISGDKVENRLASEIRYLSLLLGAFY